MYIEDIIPTIVSEYESFTKVEQVIADFFISNHQKIDFSIKTMKNKLFVSEASLTRFAQKLGFRGYREFIYQYEQVFDMTVNCNYSALKTVVQRYDELLHSFKNIINEDQIIRIVDLIVKAKRVLIVGIGSSGLAASEMKQRFIRIGVMVESCDSPDLMKMRAILQDEECLVIGISLSGSKEEILFTLRQSHQKLAKTVFITGIKKDYDYVDELVKIPALKNLDGGNIISPQFPILVVIDLIYNYFIKVNDNRKIIHKQTLEALEKK